ncbi:hypothetical protein, partial [Methanofollis fontis]
GLGGFFFDEHALQSMRDGRTIGTVGRSRSGRAVNMHLNGRLFTAAWADLLRVVRNGGKAAVFEVA